MFEYIFKDVFPIGSCYFSYDPDQIFPYGKWKYVGMINNVYVFQRYE